MSILSKTFGYFASLGGRKSLSLVTAAALGLVVSGAVSSVAYSENLYGPVPASPNMGGTLNMALLLEPPGLDPFHQAADARIRVTVLMYQGLFYEGIDGKPLPLLAESYETSADGKTLTVKLRKGIIAHSGKAITSEDVKYSYDYLRDPKNGSPGAGDFAVISSIDAVDSHTVRFNLSAPNGSLLLALGNKYGGVIPAGYFDDESAKVRMNSQSVGTGPFKLVEFNPNSNILLERNKDYWDKGMPYLDEINFVIMPNSVSMLLALRNGRLDLAGITKPHDVQQLEGVDGIFIERYASLNQKTIDMGMENEALGMEIVRQAISLAVNKEEIMKAAIGGYGQVIGTIVAGLQESWGVPLDQLPMQGVDLKRAKALLAEAGYANGLSLKLTTINGYDWMDPAAVTLKQQLEKININIDIQRVDLGVWIKNLRSRQMGFTFNDWGTQPDPNLLYYRHFHKQPGGADFRNWENDEASELLDQGRSETDYAKRKAIYTKFQKLLATSAPTIMMFSSDHIVARSAAVKNYYQHPTGWYYGLARTFLQR